MPNSPRRVLIVGNFEPDAQQSMLRYAALLVREYQKAGFEVNVRSPRLKVGTWGGTYRYSGLPKYLGYFDKFVIFPWDLRRKISRWKPDQVHIADHSNAMYAAHTRGVPTTITCHDLLQVRAARGEFPAQTVGFVGRLYQRWVLRHLKTAKDIICVSRKTAEDLRCITGLPEKAIRIVPNALNFDYRPMEQSRARAIIEDFFRDRGMTTPARFVLHVGGDQWYKNRSGVLRIFAGLDLASDSRPMLVLVGPKLSETDEQLAHRLGIADSILYAAGASCTVLNALYCNADCLLFPSLEEGYGWPIAEAVACECPVVTTNRPPMNEISSSPLVHVFDDEKAATALLAQYCQAAGQPVPRPQETP